MYRLIPAFLLVFSVSCKTSSANYRQRLAAIEKESARNVVDDPNLETLPEAEVKTGVESPKLDEADKAVDSPKPPAPEEYFAIHFKRIEMGQEFACGVTIEGQAQDRSSVYCWGSNALGEIGLGGNVQVRSFPYRVLTSENLNAVSVGSTSVCALEKGTGNTTCWGGRSLLDANTDGFGTVTVSQPLTEAQFLIADVHRCVGRFRFVNIDNQLTPETILQCWGRNRTGEFGNGTTAAEAIAIPTEVKMDLGRIYEMTEAGAGSCALANADVTPTSTKKPNKVYCWGLNDDGLVPNSTEPMLTSPTEVTGFTGDLSKLQSSGQVSCVMVGAGELSCWGENVGNLVSETAPATNGSIVPPTLIKLPFKIKSYSLSVGNICVVSTAGDVYCWGSNASGQMGTGRKSQDVIKPSQAMKIPLPLPAVQVAVNIKGGCALFANDRVSCWGDNTSGIIGSGSALPSILPPTPVYQERAF